MASVVKHLEQSTSGFIDKAEAARVLANAFETQQIRVAPITTNAIVSSVFAEADASNSGMVTRKALIDALENQSRQLDQVTDQRALPASRPFHIETVSSKIMRLLERSKKGLIAQNDLRSAVTDVATEHRIALDPAATAAFVQNVFAQADFEQSGSITRSDLHKVLDRSSATEQLFETKSLPVDTSSAVDKIMQHLNDSTSGTISKSELREVIDIVISSNGSKANNASLNAFVEKIIGSRSSMSRNDLREVL